MYSPYVISLGVPKEKLSYLSQNGLCPVLVPGVNGKLLTDQQITTAVSPWYRVLGPRSAIGCAMSHIEVWKMIRDSGAEYGIVMEDDVILVAKFTEKLTVALENVPDDYDILYLGCFGSEGESNFFTVTMSMLGMSNPRSVVNRYIRRPCVALGAHAYVVSQRGVKKLIEKLDGAVYNHIDFCLQDLASKGVLNVYVTTPRIAYQTSTDAGYSENISSCHPSLVQRYLQDIELDKMVRASYIASLSVIRIGDANLNILSIVFCILGIVFASCGIESNWITLFYMFISYSDFYLQPSGIIWIHYILLVLPGILIPYFFRAGFTHCL